MAQRDTSAEQQLQQLERFVKDRLKSPLRGLDRELDRYSPERADDSTPHAAEIYAAVMHDVHVRVARACMMLISNNHAADYSPRERQEWSARALEDAARHPHVNELAIEDEALTRALEAVSTLLQSTAASIRCAQAGYVLPA